MKKIHFFAIIAIMSLKSISQNNKVENFLDLINNAKLKSNNRQWGEAINLWQKVIKQNPVNAEFWMNLATARYEYRDYKNAIPAYRKAFNLKWEMPCERAMDIARCYSHLNENDSCFYWMKYSINLGYPRFQDLKIDSIFVKYYDQSRYKELLWMNDVSKLSKIEGWNYDLDFLNFQINRVAFNPNRNFSKNEFESKIKFIKSIIPESSDLKITAEFMELVAMVGDGHSQLYAYSEKEELKKRLPVKFHYFNDGLFVIAADSNHADLLGLEAIAFDDKSAKEIVQGIYPYIGKDNEFGANYNAVGRLSRPALLFGMGLIKKNNEITISFREPNGKIKKLFLNSALYSNINLKNNLPDGWNNICEKIKCPLYCKNPTQNYWFEEINESKIVYFKFNSIFDQGTETLKDFTGRLFKYIAENKSEKLIIDIRDNGGGNTQLLDPLLKSIMMSPLNTKGKLYCIIGRKTFSAAQNLTTYLENFTNVIFVGEPTGSTPNFIGEINSFILPFSKITANISNLYWGVSYPQDTRTWTAPAIYIEPTFESMKDGKDPVLDAILGL